MRSNNLKTIDEDSDVVLESNGIRLSVLNPEISRKLNKFNTTSDGSLTLEQAIQGLIALQKQSNNYKKMVYIMLPILVCLVASIFGVTLLAIKLSKEVQVNSSSSLTTMSGDLVRVGLETATTDLFDIVWNPMKIGSLDYISVNGTILDVTSTQQTFSNNKCRAVIRSQRLSLVLDQITSTYDVQIDNQYINDTLTQDMKVAIESWFSANFAAVVDENSFVVKPANPTCATGTFWCVTRNACMTNGLVCPRPQTTKNAASPSAGAHDGGGMYKGTSTPATEETNGELGW